MSPEEHIKGKLADYSGVMAYDDFTDLATSVAHQYGITLKEATALIHAHRGKVEIGSQEYQSQGFGPNNLWDGQDRAKNFGQHNPGDLAEPMSSQLPLSRRELVSNDKSFLIKLKKYLPEEVHAQYDQLVEKCPSGELDAMLTWVLKNASSPLKKLFWDATGYALGDTVKQKVKEVKKEPSKTDEEEQFLSDAADIKEPPLQKQAFKVGDKVRVVNNDQAPWGGEYKGIIERINAHNTFDIRDLSTGVINANQPARLLRNPLGEGRQDVRVQQRRVGDPKGMGEGQSDSGDPNTKREMPGMYMMPRGQEGKDIKNPKSVFYKEAYESLTATKKDPLYSALFTKIVKEHGAIAAANVVSYLEGKIASPPKNLTSVLRQYNIMATLNVDKALAEVKDKTVEQINAETAWNWGSRAAACYKLSSEATSEEEKDKWSSLGDEYRHESLEHAALVEDEGKLVGEVSRALAPFRKGNSHEGTAR